MQDIPRKIPCHIIVSNPVTVRTNVLFETSRKSVDQCKKRTIGKLRLIGGNDLEFLSIPQPAAEVYDAEFCTAYTTLVQTMRLWLPVSIFLILTIHRLSSMTQDTQTELDRRIHYLIFWNRGMIPISPIWQQMKPCWIDGSRNFRFSIQRRHRNIRHS